MAGLGNGTPAPTSRRERRQNRGEKKKKKKKKKNIVASGADVAIQRKNKEELKLKWTAPWIAAGNPDMVRLFNDDQGQMSRRVMTFPRKKSIVQKKRLTEKENRRKSIVRKRIIVQKKHCTEKNHRTEKALYGKESSYRKSIVRHRIIVQKKHCTEKEHHTEKAMNGKGTDSPTAISVLATISGAMPLSTGANALAQRILILSSPRKDSQIKVRHHMQISQVKGNQRRCPRATTPRTQRHVKHTLKKGDAQSHTEPRLFNARQFGMRKSNSKVNHIQLDKNKQNQSYITPHCA
jgi:hypothetical protein